MLLVTLLYDALARCTACVEPKEGDAIFFWHDHVGESGSGVGDPMAWHTGCRKGTKLDITKIYGASCWK